MRADQDTENIGTVTAAAFTGLSGNVNVPKNTPAGTILVPCAKHLTPNQFAKVFVSFVGYYRTLAKEYTVYNEGYGHALDGLLVGVLQDFDQFTTGGDVDVAMSGECIAIAATGNTQQESSIRYHIIVLGAP